MKFLVLILVGLFLLNAKVKAADESTCLIFKEDKEAYAQCIAGVDKSDAKTACTAAMKEYKEQVTSGKKDAKKDLEDAQDKIADLKKDKAKIMSDGQQDMADKDAEVQTATEAYAETQTSIKEELQKLEQDTNDQADEKVRALQKDMASYQTLITTDTDKVNSDYQSAIEDGYIACKVQSENLYASLIGMIRQSNQLANRGLKKSSGANFVSGSTNKNAQNKAKTDYTTCTNKMLREKGADRSSKMSTLTTNIKSLEQEINNKKMELDRLTNGDYTKKVGSLNEKLANEATKLANKQNQVNTQKTQLQQKMMEETRLIDEQILLIQQRTGALSSAPVKSGKKELTDAEQDKMDGCLAVQTECCEDGKGKAGLSGYDSFCKSSCGGKKATRKSGGSNRSTK